jgi:hypothetical protein
MQAGIMHRVGIGRERGVVLITALGLVTVMAMVGAIAAYMSTTNVRIGGNERTSMVSFYAAEAGTEEARARLPASAGDVRIIDNSPDSTAWRVFIGSDDKAAVVGYEAGNPDHELIASLQDGLSYTVVIRHAETDGQVEFWGDPNGDGVFTRNTAGASPRNQNIYRITSYGTDGATLKTVAIETVQLPPPSAPGPLYVEAPTNLLGSSTTILGAVQANTGNEPCGAAAVPGISTILAQGDGSGYDPIDTRGDLTITGDPDIRYGARDINIQAMIDTFKPLADFTYTVSSETMTGSETPGPGEGWGTPTNGPTLQDPSSCSEAHIIHIDTQGTYVRLSGQTTGCGMLLVEGDLDVNGGFSWYGPILVSGQVIYTGGGNKQVTGTVMSEGSADLDVIGGNANIVYCSTAINNINVNRPMRILNWLEVL